MVSQKDLKLQRGLVAKSYKMGWEMFALVVPGPFETTLSFGRRIIFYKYSRL
jgi:hypothetical protein